MKEQQVIRLALPLPLRKYFDYLPPENIDFKALIPGIRVQVPFQQRSLVGILVSVENKSDVPYAKLKRAQAILDTQPLVPEDVYKLCLWAAEYYHYSVGEVLASALPTLLRKGKPAILKVRKKEEDIAEKDTALELNADQQFAVQQINQAKETFQVFLLNGVTGSGKTEVYLQSMTEILQAGKQVLVLVPEISLTPQTVQRFRQRFSQHKILALHSSLTEQQRLQAWLMAKSNDAQIIIGTRSAIFTPLAALGLIIVDEEHDASFKQQDRFRYHARDLAIMRANMNHIPVVLGSATPSLESMLNVKRNRYQLLSLPIRAGVAQLPDFRLLDLRTLPVQEGLSSELINMIRVHLQRDNQVMLFLNRRGFAPVLYCTQCAWMAACKRCDARMVYHQHPERLQCHHCDTRSRIPEKCQQCGDTRLQPVGLGTQRLEQTLAKLFPNIPLIRVDRDSTRRKGEMQNLLEQIANNSKAILLGTQMLAKGHHFPNVTLVGVIDADSGLFSADFRAAEQMGQLLMQVSGRAGRAEKAGVVAIQTRHPDHALLQLLIKKGYQAYADNLLGEREMALLPPFSYFAVFRAEAYVEDNVKNFLTIIRDMLPNSLDTLQVMGPVPAIMARKKGLHCQHLLMKTNKRSVLQATLKNILQQLESLTGNHAVKWVLDVDPVEV